MVDAGDEPHVREHPRRRGRHHCETDEADHVREQDRVAEAGETVMAAEIDPEEGEADHRELRVPVRPGCGGQEEGGGVRDPLHCQLVEVMAHPLLERDDAQGIHEGLGRVAAVRHFTNREVREVEAEPDHELEAEVAPAARQHTPSQSDYPLHAGTLDRAVTGGLPRGDWH